MQQLNESGDYYTKWSKSRRQIPWYHLYVKSKIWHKLTYLQNRPTDIESKFMLIKGEREWGREGLGVWD